jgi:hypothetical protein
LVLVVLELIATLQAEQTVVTQYFQPSHLRAAAVGHRAVTINRFQVAVVQAAVQVEPARVLELAEVAQLIKVMQVVRLWDQILIYQPQAAVLTRLRPIQPQAVSPAVPV